MESTHKLKINLYFWTLILILILSVKDSKSQTCKEVIGYLPNWQWYDRAKLVNPQTIQYSKYSILNYCFFKPESSGLISNTDSWADENLLQGQINWQTTPTSYYPNTSVIDLAHNAGTKVMVSIGGWTLSDNFPGIAASPQKRAVFAGECNRLIKYYHFDGIDIDWEYPGFADHSGTAADKANFTLLLKQIRDSITALGSKTGQNYLLSACFGASKANMSNIEWSEVQAYLDMINVMSYDFFGTWDGRANHNSPLFAPAQGDSTFNLNSAFKRLINTYGVDANKINLGVAFYGRSQTGASGLYGITNGTADTQNFLSDEGTPLYYNIVSKLNWFNRFWDNNAQVPYLLGKVGTAAAGTFVSYDDEESVGLKARYISEHSARGAIIWEITGDYVETFPGSGVLGSTPLIDTLVNTFCKLASDPTFEKEVEQKPLKSITCSWDKDKLIIINNSVYTGSIQIIGLAGEVLHVSEIEEGVNMISTVGLSKGIYLVRIPMLEPLTIRYVKSDN